jgi:colanic acid biosynthesis glycosyl transferase WcaI
MKILIYGLNFSPELTGVGKYTGEMAEWLVSNGHDVCVITTKPYYPHWKPSKNIWLYKRDIKKILTDSGIEVSYEIWRCPIYVPRNPTFFKRIIHLFSFSIFSIPILFSKLFFNPKIIWTVQPTIFCLPFALLFSLLSKAKSVLHIQDFEIGAALSIGFMKNNGFVPQFISYLEKFLYSKFDLITTISKEMEAKLLSFGIVRDKVAHFPNWSNVDDIYPINNYDSSYFSNILNIDVNAKIVLYSGNIGEKQGIDLILESSRLLLNNPEIVFVICGTGSSVNRFKLQSSGMVNVKWLELQPLEALNLLLNFADIHLVPQKENLSGLVLPSKITSIFASGVPAIVSCSPGSALYDICFQRAVTIPPNDSRALADAISFLFKNEVLYSRYSSAARNFSIVNFNKNSILRKFEELLFSII